MAAICPDCRVPTFPGDEHECGHNEWRAIVRRDGLPDYVAEATSNVFEIPAMLRDVRAAYRHDPAARVLLKRRWVDGWSLVEDDGAAFVEAARARLSGGES